MKIRMKAQNAREKNLKERGKRLVPEPKYKKIATNFELLLLKYSNEFNTKNYTIYILNIRLLMSNTRNL